MSATINYKLLSRKFIIIPLVIVLIVSSLVYITGELLIRVENEITRANHINKLLAKSITTKNSVLISQQVQQILESSPQYESIMYYPLPSNKTVPVTTYSNYTLLFDPSLSIIQPVSDTLLTNTKISPPLRSTVTGYLNLTLDLQKVRITWLKQSFVTILLVFFIWFIILSILLSRLQKLTKRLPVIESLSKKALLNDTTTDELYQLPKEQTSAWLFEQALIHLLNQQKTLTNQINQLKTNQQLILADKTNLIRQNSNFQNTLSYEFKASLTRIESGIQMLKNHYVSKEQEDAVNTINQGVGELNAKLNQIIQLTRIEKGQAVVQLNQFNPTQLINEIIEKNQSQAHEKSLNLIAKCYHADYTLEGDVQKITTILYSLIENALHFTEYGGVEVISQLQHLEKNIRWKIEIIDTGIGIHKGNLEHLFEPFFQANTTLKHTYNNQTVGLFLVNKLISILGGSIEVESQPNIGSTFTVTLTLHDWENQYERSLLKDKIVCYWGEHESLNALYKRLSNTGAMIRGFDDSTILLNYLISHKVDILLISPSINYASVLTFIKQLRDIETTYRVLVVYYQNNQLDPQQIEDLSIEGLDYFDKIEQDKNNIDKLVKKIIQYLN